MTLVLTKVTPDGIAMAADAALTESYKKYDRILIGASKLLLHRPSSTCLGTFGGALLPHPVPGNTPLQLEFVLRDFCDMAKTINSGEEFTLKLTEWLNENFPIARNVIGIDVSSVRPTAGVAQPVVYRVMNARQPDGEPGKFQRHVLRAPGNFDDSVDRVIIVAGETNAGFGVDEIRAGIRNAMVKTGGTLPEAAEPVAAWLAVMVRMISDLYQNLRIGRSIDGPVSTVIINTATGVLRDGNTPPSE